VFTALLDTSVLWPSLQRDFLLSLAIEGLYRPVWSWAILEELEYHEAHKLTNRGVPRTEAEQRARRLIEQMQTAFDDAEVTGWDRLEGTFGLPDPDDEHGRQASPPTCKSSHRPSSPTTPSASTPCAHCAPSRPSLLAPDRVVRPGRSMTCSPAFRPATA
jgi:hypothetical protein